MNRLGKFKLLGLVAVLIALLTAVGGLVISQAAGGQSGIQAAVYDDAVRFTVQNDQVEILRASARGITRDGTIPGARVFDLAGKRLFDSGPG